MYLKLAIALVTLIACTGCVAAPNFDARSPSKTLVRVRAMNQAGVQQGRILLGDVATVVGGNVVRCQLAVTGVSNHAY